MRNIVRVNYRLRLDRKNMKGELCLKTHQPSPSHSVLTELDKMNQDQK